MHAANDMKELLDRAEERPPYLLVGASYGALVARYFATKYPGSVSAMVLVDGHHEDEFDRINKLSGGKYALMMASVEEHHQNCLAASRRHISPRSPEYTSCVPPPPSFANRRLTAVNLSQFLSPHYWESALSEWQSLHAASTQQVRSLDEKPTSIPVVALVRSVSPFAIPGRPPSALNRAVERENAKMQQETASLSLFGRTVVIPQAGHAIHLDNPRAVIQQVLLVHRSVRL
jgi:pimeloyl-ACP methyl ester carboxylesterase